MPVALVLGACAMATAYAIARCVAPFYGFGPVLVSASFSVSLAAIGAGLLLASREGAGRGWASIPEASARAQARKSGSRRAAMLVAAIWTIGVPWGSAFVLSALEPLGLRTATILGTVVLAATPLTAIGFVLGSLAESDGRSSAAAGAALLGAAIAAPLVLWIMVPLLGLARTLLCAGAVEVLLTLVIGTGPSGRVGVAAPLALVVLAGLSAARFPGVERDPSHGLVETREGPSAQYRVIDREDGRFLLADGGIQTLVSSDTRDALERPAAAFRILDLLSARPESVLVLGLRGGAVAKRLARSGWRVTAVEPDPTALAMAARHLSFHTEEVPVIGEDVRVFCRRGARRYPAVIFDAYAQSVIPFHLITRECLDAVGDRVAGDGMLLLAIVTRGWRDPVLSSLAAMLHARFRTVLALPTSEPPNTLGSVVLLASNRALEMPDERLPQPTDYLMNPEEHWNVVQMNHAWFNRFAPPTRGAVIMTDDRNPIDLWSDRVEHAARTELHTTFAKPPRSW